MITQLKITAAYLLSDGSPAVVTGAVKLVGFPEQGVKRFARADGRVSVGRDGEGCHMRHLLARVLYTRRERENNQSKHDK